MLRLRVGRTRNWIDSHGRSRSPLERMTVLCDSARDVVTRSTPFVAWEIGVLEDEQGERVYSKPQAFGGDTHLLGYSVTANEATDLHPVLERLWPPILKWLGGGAKQRVFVADDFWGYERKWIDFDAALRSGILDVPGLRFKRTAVALTYTALASPGDITTLATSWWPSAGGMLAGVVLSGEDSQLDEQVAESGCVAAENLPHLSLCYQSSSAFENLGLTVISQGSNWPEIESSLASRGWIDGVSVASLLG